MVTQELNLSIDKESLNKLPTVHYQGKVMVVEDSVTSKNIVASLMNEKEIGFDTETRPSFRKGQTFKVALLQLSTRECCYLFRINKIGFTEELRKLLSSEDVKKIGLSVHDDFNSIRRSEKINFGGFLDLQDYVKDFGIKDISLQKIYAIIFKERISKSQRLTNWEAPQLTSSQQTYAALDAWACLNIYDKLRSGEFVPEQNEFAHAVE